MFFFILSFFTINASSTVLLRYTVNACDSLTQPHKAALGTIHQSPWIRAWAAALTRHTACQADQEKQPGEHR